MPFPTAFPAAFQAGGGRNPGAPRRKARRGTQAVEFALVLPVLLALTTGIIDYGWFYSNQLSVVHAVREGARIGATADPDAGDDPEVLAYNRAMDELENAGIDVHADDVVTELDGPSGDQVVVVTATVDFHPLVGLLDSPLLGSAYPSNYHASGAMRLESQPGGS